MKRVKSWIIILAAAITLIAAVGCRPLRISAPTENAIIGITEEEARELMKNAENLD